jgi:hypothetical protein
LEDKWWEHKWWEDTIVGGDKWWEESTVLWETHRVLIGETVVRGLLQSPGEPWWENRG